MSELLHISGGPTKPEIIAVSLSKLDLSEGCTFYDIGCGTGAVSIAASKLARNIKFTAIDARQEAIEVAEKNFKNFGLDCVKLIHGESSEVLEQLPPEKKIDCAFVGGTKNIGAILKSLVKHEAGSIIVNAVRIETVVSVMNQMKELGIFDTITNISISRGYPITGETMFKPENPVYMISGKYSNIQGDKKC
ncbi:precorrin-6Y C5,15-methyltransferase (decarboxylating) subunit CbiT [Methanohalophilus euhalobius]|uniref:Probable cobalt-precorrin-6B C(15)-methyltransferase (decarboxylating) n=1 Tax=Methanohalophilus euhalobius TaxID=51203 RepID=A0A314ZWX0_9EURY|nr:precorrin-6Y C5,15-methyltransferase (decarboxylating) subunit CbiT [Methanohalophilus euhalobius]PQV43609.1 cobalt-precorrin-6B (C15)-methyltransferase [Methanohalophilus euhalobius]RNI12612.1 precorrin-6Y C5,15-methyltransferase (decarboxylating) subunit CbiT [Methanohalophilus euhalobius]